MSTQAPYGEVAYGLSSPLVNVSEAPIVSLRAPTTADQAQIGTLWIFKPSNAAYVLTSVVANSANWLQIQSSGGSGVFTTVTASGNITSTGGNITATTGNMVAGGSVTAGNGVSVTGGNVTVATGDVIADAGFIEGVGVIVTGDLGGTTGDISLTNVTNTSQSSGALSILSTTANPGNNAGFVKIYVGTGIAYIPYFTNIAP